MKHFQYSLAVLGVLASSVVVLQSPQAALTGSVTIEGRVPEECEILVTPDTSGQRIDNISVSTTMHLVATVTETCNRSAGYRVTVEGQNSGNNTGLFIEPTYIVTDTNAQQPFTVFYNGTQVPSGGEVTNTSAPVAGATKEVRISFSNKPSLPSTSGYTYTEVLTFTMAPK